MRGLRRKRALLSRLAILAATGNTLVACGAVLGIDPVSFPDGADGSSVEAAGPGHDGRADTSEGGSSGDASDGGAVLVGDAGAPCDGALDCERVVFASSAVVKGSNLAAPNADVICNQFADASTNPRVHGRPFRAWISYTNQPAATRLQHGTGAYVTSSIPARRIATGFDELTSGQLETEIAEDENGGGGAVATTSVWTGTLPDGGAQDELCDNWRDAGASSTPGVRIAINGNWTFVSSANQLSRKCSQLYHLYCVEDYSQ